MLRSLYTAASGMDAQQTKMDVTANNLANVNTTGFKRVRAEFEELLSETYKQATAPDPRGGGEASPMQVGLGVRTSATTRSMAQGDMLNTGGPTDLALEGAGYFRVQRPNGELAYTRAGNFRVDATGRLVTQHGDVLQPGITVPPETTAITVKPDGTVSATVSGRTDPVDLGAIDLATFQNPQGLFSLGNNLFQQTGASGEAQVVKPGEQGTGAIAQGYLEGSNVKSVEEMIDLISTQRAYELNSKVIQTADQMLQRLTSLR